jgi:hypothetical protein
MSRISLIPLPRKRERHQNFVSRQIVNLRNVVMEKSEPSKKIRVSADSNTDAPTKPQKAI